MGVEFESFKETGDIEYTADEGAACGINGCTNLSLVKSRLFGYICNLILVRFYGFYICFQMYKRRKIRLLPKKLTKDLLVGSHIITKDL